MKTGRRERFIDGWTHIELTSWWTSINQSSKTGELGREDAIKYEFLFPNVSSPAVSSVCSAFATQIYKSYSLFFAWNLSMLTRKENNNLQTQPLRLQNGTENPLRLQWDQNFTHKTALMSFVYFQDFDFLPKILSCLVDPVLGRLLATVMNLTHSPPLLFSFQLCPKAVLFEILRSCWKCLKWSSS